MSQQATTRLREWWEPLRFFPDYESSTRGREDDSITSCGVRFNIRHTSTLDNPFAGSSLAAYGMFGQPSIRVPLSRRGDIICGIVHDAGTDKARLSPWFACEKAFQTLVDVVRGSLTLSEAEMKHQLRARRGYVDRYWAVAQLVLFDNVDLFQGSTVMLKRLRRPAVSGLDIPDRQYRFVHEMSYALGEPQWWEHLDRKHPPGHMYELHDRYDQPCMACAAGR
jgi:hypothetical protein